MKKILIFLCFLQVLYANEILLHQQISAHTKIESTLYHTRLEIRASEKLRESKNLSTEVKNAIIKTYNFLNKKSDNFCVGGSFKIEPIYNYVNSKKQEVGYQTNWDMQCKFNASLLKDFNQFLALVEEEVQKNPYLSFGIPAIHPIVDEEVYKSYDDVLNQDLLKKAMEQAQMYSKILHKTCTIKEITLGSTQSDATPKVALKSTKSLNNEATLESIIAPKGENVDKSIQGKVTYHCI